MKLLVPSDDEQDGSDLSVGHSSGNRGNNGVIVDGNSVGSGIAHTGHGAALDGSGQQLLGSGVLGGGGQLIAAADGQGEADLVAVNLLMGQSGLVTESGQIPVAGSIDGDGVDLDRAVGVVDDLGVSCSGHGAVGADSDGQDGGNGDGHGGGSGVTVQGTICGGGQGDTGGSGAAVSGDFGSGSEREKYAHTHDQTNNTDEILHS